MIIFYMHVYVLMCFEFLHTHPHPPTHTHCVTITTIQMRTQDISSITEGSFLPLSYQNPPIYNSLLKQVFWLITFRSYYILHKGFVIKRLSFFGHHFAHDFHINCINQRSLFFLTCKWIAHKILIYSTINGPLGC